MKAQELFDKIKNNRSAIFTMITFFGYSKPNYDKLKIEVEELLGVKIDEIPEGFYKLAVEKYYK